ncbi:hypothetical protein BC940DRAFT_44123 [Gongronella butleri]|nr:hypothetical protein BC940DRAFT_44123 [Gongronella butleri]
MSSKFLKDMKTRLDDYGYTHHWKLNKEKTLTDDAPEYDATSDLNEILLANSKMPQCQNADIIIPDKKRTADRVYQLRQFMAILGTPIKPAPTIDGSSSQAPLEKPAHASSVTHDEDLRQFRIQEFIDTERSYLESLQAALQCVVQPLSNDPNYKHILNTYKCTKIFLNLPRLHEVTELFLRDLESRPGQFGQVCYDHMSEFKCYRKYLMEQHDAQQLHAKELRANSLYKRFIDDARQHPLFKMRKFKDVLMEPVQRVGRYAMMLKDILQLTPSGHPDYAGLTAACQLIRDIATMADDAPTKAATMFMNIYNAVKECPCSLVNPNRSLVAFLDAYEIQRDTNTPARSVTLFLFTDKIMVAARPSHQRTEEALQAWQDLMPSGVTSNGTGTPTGGSKREPTMKFKGWIGIDAIELFGGNTQDTTADTFLLHAAPPLSSSLTERRASITTASYEKYFRKGPRLFSVAPGSSKSTSVTQFRVAVEKVKALSRKYSDKDMAYERKWHSMNVYSNVYTVDDYLAAETRNNIAILYMESTSDIDLERLFPTSGNAPWIVALIQADLRGFRFHVCSRIPLAAAEPAAPAPATSLSSSTHESTTIDFERVFWNNVLLCERKLRHAPMFSNQHDKVLRSEVQKKSRSRSVPRPSSLTSISKIFNHGINLPLSPVSPK